MITSRVLVVGASGFLGSRVVATLVSQGHSVLVPSRRYENAKHLASLPGVEVVETALSNEQQVQAFLLQAQSGQQTRIRACINLVGILHGRAGKSNQDLYGPDFGAVHVELTQRLAIACQEAGIRRFIHVSALGVVDGGKKTLPSRYLRSKAAGEQVLKQTLGLQTTIFRPSVLFGEGDSFLNLFGKLQTFAPIMPLACANARFQPVYVGDVASAIVNSLQRNDTIGKTYELAGPDIYSLKQLVQIAGSMYGHSRPVLALPSALGRLQATLMECAPGPTLLSRDNLDSMSIDNCVEPNKQASLKDTAAALGINWHSLADMREQLAPVNAANSGLNAMRRRAGR